jgi:hypothetical protein
VRPKLPIINHSITLFFLLVHSQYLQLRNSDHLGTFGFFGLIQYSANSWLCMIRMIAGFPAMLPK